MRRIDRKLLLNDPFLLLLLVVPALALTATRFGVGPLLHGVSTIVEFDTGRVSVYVETLVFAATPFLTALAPAFLCFDERDTGVYLQFACSPTPIGRLLRPRLARVALFQTLYATLALLLFTMDGTGTLPVAIIAVAPAVVQAPLVVLLLLRIAPDKITGLSAAKALSLTVVLPIIFIALVDRWAVDSVMVLRVVALALCALPATWSVVPYLAFKAPETVWSAVDPLVPFAVRPIPAFFVVAVLGVGVQILFVIVLWRSFSRRVVG